MKYFFLNKKLKGDIILMMLPENSTMESFKHKYIFYDCQLDMFCENLAQPSNAAVSFVITVDVVLISP